MFVCDGGNGGREWVGVATAASCTLAVALMYWDLHGRAVCRVELWSGCMVMCDILCAPARPLDAPVARCGAARREGACGAPDRDTERGVGICVRRF